MKKIMNFFLTGIFILINAGVVIETIALLSFMTAFDGEDLTTTDTLSIVLIILWGLFFALLSIKFSHSRKKLICLTILNILICSIIYIFGNYAQNKAYKNFDINNEKEHFSLISNDLEEVVNSTPLKKTGIKIICMDNRDQHNYGELLKKIRVLCINYVVGGVEFWTSRNIQSASGYVYVEDEKYLDENYSYVEKINDHWFIFSMD